MSINCQNGAMSGANASYAATPSSGTGGVSSGNAIEGDPQAGQTGGHSIDLPQTFQAFENQCKSFRKVNTQYNLQLLTFDVEKKMMDQIAHQPKVT